MTIENLEEIIGKHPEVTHRIIGDSIKVINWYIKALEHESARAERWKAECIRIWHEVDMEFDGFIDLSSQELLIDKIDKGQE